MLSFFGIARGLKLSQKPCPIDELFPKGGSTIFGGNYLTGILWALETLAWSEDYLSRVILNLAELSTHDPGSNWGNRPINSINTILLPWLPQTTASIEKRIGAIKAIQKDFPEIAWKTLLNMMPSSHQTSSGCQKPQWRKFIPENWDNRATDKEYWEQVTQYVEFAIQMAQQDTRYSTQLVNYLDNIPASSFEKYLAYLSSDKISELSEEDRRPIWETLCAFINKHRRFADTNWALPSDVVDRIEKIATKIEPVQPQYAFQRLFVFDDWKLYEENDKYDEQAKKFEEDRQNAIKTILSDSGIDALIRFVEIIEDSSKAGWSLGKIAGKEIDDYLLPAFLDKQELKGKQFISSFILSRFNESGTEWIDKLDRIAWTTEQQCQFLIYLPFEQDAWNRAKSWLGKSEEYYWKKVEAVPIRTQSELAPAIDKLLENGRPRLVIECLGSLHYHNKVFDHKKAVQALLNATSSDEPIRTLYYHNVTEIIKILQNDPNINEDDLANIEWAYLPLLEKNEGNRPRFLEKHLSTKPEFYCEVIQFLFRSKKEEKKEDEVDEHKQAIAHLAWKLLHDWQRPPGLDDNGLFSANNLIEWYQKVKQICIDSGHLEVALIKLGEVLFYAPADTDGLWIHKAVAQLIDDKESEYIRQGFSTKVFNSRGVYNVDPSGKPEQELSELWKKKAEDVEAAGYVRFAATLREISRGYEREKERIISEHKTEIEGEIEVP